MKRFTFGMVMQTAKIIVVGSFASGKDAFIQAISEIDLVATELQTAENHVALYFGRYTVDDELVIHLFGTPDTRRFEFAWDINYSRDLLGYVIVINNALPDAYPEAERIVNLFRKSAPAPFVVAVNVQDDTNGLSPEELRQVLHQPESVKFIPYGANDTESVKKVLLGLMYEIFDRVNIRKQGA